MACGDWVRLTLQVICTPKPQNPKPYLEGHGDFVDGLRMGITRVTTWVIGVINLLTKSP